MSAASEHLVVPPGSRDEIGPRDRANGNIYFIACLLLYVAAPVRYVGVIQAALCDKLDASRAVANLPTTFYFFACFAPIVCAGFVPHRLERSVVVACCWGIALLSALAAAVLLVPMPNGIRIGVIIGQSLLLGLLNAVEQVFLLQCLGRGTTPRGRARALKLTFTLGPLAAVVGSLAAQWIIRDGVPGLRFPRDFALLYLFGALCSVVTALACARFSLEELPEARAQGFGSYVIGGFRRFCATRDLRYLWLGYVLWYAALLALPNLSLYTRVAMNREPSDFSGVIMAIQFAAKAAAGFAFGTLLPRWGEKLPVVGAALAAMISALWAWWVPGYAFLLAFVFMGAAQLGGIYFPNVLLARSPTTRSTQDLAVLNLATVFASPAPTIYGFATDHWGFATSFALAVAAALGAVIFVSLISAPRGDPNRGEAKA